MIKCILGHFFQRSKGQLSFFVASRRLSSRSGTCSSLHPAASLASLVRIWNKLAKGICLARKERDREVFI